VVPAIRNWNMLSFSRVQWAKDQPEVMTMMNDLGLSDGNQVRNAKNNAGGSSVPRTRWILLDFNPA